jgi:hypothetical protein
MDFEQLEDGSWHFPVDMYGLTEFDASQRDFRSDLGILGQDELFTPALIISESGEYFFRVGIA